MGVNSNQGQTFRELESHRLSFAIRFPILKDVGGRVASALDAHVCPEAMLFDAKGELQYRGRIDDRFSQRGGSPKEPGQQDLRNAVSQLLAGEPFKVATTDAIGCPIDLPEKLASTDGTGQPVTYAKDIAPILLNRCQDCHHDGGVAPFPLSSYDDARTWARDIRDFTADRRMPPWRVSTTLGQFRSDRSIPQPEIDAIAAWVAAGTPPGELSQAPLPREFSAEWKLGTPDLIIEPKAEYTLGAEGPDEYRNFVIPVEFDRLKYLRAVDVQPGNKAVVHHVFLFADTSGKARELDELEPGEGYNELSGVPRFFPASELGGWAPGTAPQVMSGGFARMLPRKCDVVLQVHYHRTGKDERDRTRVGFYFSKEPVRHLVESLYVMPLPGRGARFEIPANANNHKVRFAGVIPSDRLLLGIGPHMHLLGKDMVVTATFPSGKKETLIDLKRWDFYWQEGYGYPEPVLLPKGTRIDVVAHFDNSSSNPSNPSKPPRDAAWGEGTTDEMCLAVLSITRPTPAKTESELYIPTGRDRLKFMIETNSGAEGASRLRSLMIDAALNAMTDPATGDIKIQPFDVNNHKNRGKGQQQSDSKK